MEAILETRKRAQLAKALLIQIVEDASVIPNPPLLFNFSEGKGVVRIDSVYFETEGKKAKFDRLLDIIDGITISHFNDLISIEVTINRR